MLHFYQNLELGIKPEYELLVFNFSCSRIRLTGKRRLLYLNNEPIPTRLLCYIQR
jgi:hypothetical protein